MISRFLECSSSRLCPRRYDDDAIVVEINFEAGYMTARLRIRASSAKGADLPMK